MYQYCISRSVPTLFLIVETQDFSWPERRTRVLRRCLGSFWSDTSSWCSSGWLPMKGLICSFLDAPETWTPLYVTFSLNRCSQTDPSLLVFPFPRGSASNSQDRALLVSWPAQLSLSFLQLICPYVFQFCFGHGRFSSGSFCLTSIPTLATPTYSSSQPGSGALRVDFPAQLSSQIPKAYFSQKLDPSLLPLSFYLSLLALMSPTEDA